MNLSWMRKTIFLFLLVALIFLGTDGKHRTLTPREWLEPQSASAYIAEMPRVLPDNPYLAARRLLETGDMAGADSELSRAIALHPTLAPYLRVWQAEARLRTSDTPAALALLDQVATSYPRAVSGRALNRAAQVRASYGDRDAARASYALLLERTTGDDRRQVGVELARVEAAAGDSRAASDRLWQVLKLAGSPQVTVTAADVLSELLPSDPVLAARLAPVYYDAGRFPKAAALYERALAGNAYGAGTASALLQLGRSYERGDEFRTAIGVYKRLRLEYPGVSSGLIAYRIGLCHQRVGEDQEGERWFQEVLDRDPRSSFADDILYRMAARRDQRDDRDAARVLYQRLLDRYPRSSWADEAAWKIGFGHFEDGRPAEALVAFESALRRYPNSDFAPAMGYWHARILEEQGRSAEARVGFVSILKNAADAYYRGRAVAALRRMGVHFSAADLVPAEDLARSGDIPAAIREARVIRDAGDGEAAERARVLVAEWTRRAGGWSDLARFSTDVLDTTALLFDAPRVSPAVLDEIQQLVELGAYDEAVAEILAFRIDAGVRPERRLAHARILAEGGAYRAAMREIEGLVRGLASPADAASLPPVVARLLFPGYYAPLVRAEAGKYGVDPLFMLSVIREESRFQADVSSWAGAQGLMQIMPATGATVARQLGMADFSVEMLHDPQVNIALGARYLSGLMQQYEGRHHLALAGYNAGPGNANRWVRQSPGAPDDVFVERISFRETRNYVKRVLGTYWTYRQLAGETIVGI